MKEKFLILIIVVFSMLVIPLTTLSKADNTSVPTGTPENYVPYEKQDVVLKFDKIKVLKDDKVSEFSTNDYLFGVIAAEMPALYEKEAIKAQAVAAYTFACYKKSGADNSKYDITAEGDTAQCFITRKEAAARWGEKAEEYSKKIDECISSVLGEVLTYDNEPIFAAYHAISPGVTNSCKDVWGKDIPYLISVDSTGDALAANYLSESTFSRQEITEKLKSIATPSQDGTNYFSNIKAASTGLVTSIDFCGKTVAGAQIRELLGLRSSNFTINYAEDKFTFTVKGYGHGVGMSQTGANYMAKQGKTYDEILLHYYNGATLQKN